MNVPVSDSLHKRVRVHCAKADISVSEFVRRAVMKALDEAKSDKKP